MIGYETKLEKSKFSGWRATTRIELGDIVHDGRPAKRILVFTTSKVKGRVCDTFASACIEQDTGRGYSMTITAVFSEYFKRIMDHPDVERVTDKAIRLAHERCFDLFPAHIAAAMDYYATKEKVAS